MIDDLRRRSAAEVFEDHLRLAGEHRFEEDIQFWVPTNSSHADATS